MSKEISLGTNRTGLKASPKDSVALLECLDLQPAPPDPVIDMTDIRRSYRNDADAIGSMPPPTNLRGAAGAAGAAMMGRRMHILLDKMGERAAFERTGTRLYDAALIRLSDAPLPEGMSLSELLDIREDEHSHFLLLTKAIEKLGGDPTCQTPCADFAAVQGMGLMQAINDPRATLPQILETLLAAELIDATSWEMLIELASGMKQSELANQMLTALEAERIHVRQVRKWLSLSMEQSVHFTGTE